MVCGIPSREMSLLTHLLQVIVLKVIICKTHWLHRASCTDAVELE
jgi:hypothetical protein